MAQEEKIIPERYRDHYEAFGGSPENPGTGWLWARQLIEELGAAESSLSTQAEEMRRMRAALEQIAEATDPDAVEENYRADDREGCLDYVFAKARAALSPQVAATQEAQNG